MDPTVSGWGTIPTPVNGNDQVLLSTVSTDTPVLKFLDFIIALFGLSGNAVVLWLLGFCMKRTAISVYILNLAGAEFISLFLEITESLKEIIEYFYSITISFSKFFFILSTSAYIADITLFLAITTECCLSGMCPIWYQYHRPRHTSSVMCSMIWILSLLFSILHWSYCQFTEGGYFNAWCLVFYFIAAALIIFLLALFSCLSLTRLVKSLCGSRRIQLTGLNLTTGLTVLVFLLCDLPLGISSYFLMRNQEISDVYHKPLYLVTTVLSYVTKCAKPIIYFLVGFFKQWQRQHQRWWQLTLKVILQRALEDYSEVGESGGSPPQETLEMSGISQRS
ncbi:mas-related G-protein coupled receptor member X2-like [Sorex araneus]|uniref:mas-related G-protein coupled receptor member X2-like n=1 Tax=Sorex araneus TaxID=42254 RepID=UPI002433656E|nr:mas-related G-protein coupled receptor member X2-like [Sorex araneus]